MNILQIVKTKKFSKLDQFQRRKLVSDFILNEKDCKVGTKVICFETEAIVNEKNKFFYNIHGKGRAAASYISIGNEYSIIEYKDGKIKIENDDGRKLWYTINRFLYSLKIERKEKLKKINLCQTE